MDWGEIGLIFFDKLLIGLVLLGVAYWTKRVLQKSKMTFGFALKFSEERIRRIGQIWTEIDECEALLREFQRAIGRIAKGTDRTKTYELADQATSVGNKTVEKFNALRLKIDSNRFWLGDDSVYQSLMSHTDLLSRHLDAFSKRQEEGRTPLKELDEEIRKSRKTISNYLKLP